MVKKGISSLYDLVSELSSTVHNDISELKDGIKGIQHKQDLTNGRVLKAEKDILRLQTIAEVKKELKSKYYSQQRVNVLDRLELLPVKWRYPLLIIISIILYKILDGVTTVGTDTLIRLIMAAFGG